MINNVKHFRKNKRITQSYLARECKVTRQTIISVESNKYIPSFLLIAKISKILETPIDELLILERKDWD